MFSKVLVANRGEIAVRVIRALRELGIRSVAIYSDPDRPSLAVRMADEAYPLEGSASADTYLRIDKILDIARRSRAEAIHPGYGFLSENPSFAAACEDAGVIFIGPPASAIEKLGSKTAARKLAKAAGTPVLPGTEDPVRDAEEARAIAEEIGYPVLLKAAAGGGGKGMRRVDRAQDLEAALRDATSEAERSFKSSDVFIEKLVIRPRHIEIQLFADRHGNCIYLGERECSIQRRHQKVIEECPSPLVAAHPEMRRAMGEAAVASARAAGYVNAGTAEFLVDENRNFYFLEMNTRLQVEHPVTELVTGLDLVHLQLRIAAGERLPLTQDDVTLRGWAIECRVYAEDPESFLPQPGKLTRFDMPSGPGIRVDSGVYPGWTVPMEYDPLLAKLCVYGETRQQAIVRLRRALEEAYVGGIRANLPLFRAIANDPRFVSGELDTAFLDGFRLPAEAPPPGLAATAAKLAKPISAVTPRTAGSAWKRENRRTLYR
ncbi:MAG: acetyl-CoA carboxylase biotin carboxylase subunit [Bryobacteraceae bacterium]|nr:acetyl-CoA carboxylase biotin carboxylase subunit [Bryobacteraceae bacterium]